jgi:AcrR family transcriptional regulator
LTFLTDWANSSMPRDGTVTRKRILEGALALLRERGLSGFSVEGVASRAKVPKGLVLYHYGSRAALVALCAGRLERERIERLSAAAAHRLRIEDVDAQWEELVRQQEDGTARAWLSLAAAGALTATVTDDDLGAQARRSLLDGCAVALAAGAEHRALREAYEALSLALLQVDEAG